VRKYYKTRTRQGRSNKIHIFTCFNAPTGEFRQLYINNTPSGILYLHIPRFIWSIAASYAGLLGTLYEALSKAREECEAPAF
jgi:hypothetical protein